MTNVRIMTAYCVVLCQASILRSVYKHRHKTSHCPSPIAASLFRCIIIPPSSRLCTLILSRLRGVVDTEVRICKGQRTSCCVGKERNAAMPTTRIDNGNQQKQNEAYLPHT